MQCVFTAPGATSLQWPAARDVLAAAHRPYAGSRGSTLCRIAKTQKLIPGRKSTNESEARVLVWVFVTRPVRGVGYVAWNGEWRAIDEQAEKRSSTRTFSTFRECVADARLNSFAGNLDPAGFAPFSRRPEARFVWS
jgi:hypothetical protein